MSELQSVEVEAAACRAACAGLQVSDGVGHLHHRVLGEKLTEPIEARIQYILRHKPEDERARRLRAMRPWPGYADYEAKRAPLDADYEAKRDALDADYEAKRDALDADYEAKRAPLDADYEAKRAPLYADYEAKRAPLDADYEAKCDALYADAHAQFCTPDCPWDGKTLLPEGVPA